MREGATSDENTADPLLLEGCKVALQWPRTRIGKPPIRRVATVAYLPGELGRRRHARNVYLLTFFSDRPKARQHPRLRWTRWARLRRRQLCVLEGSGRRAGPRWCAEEEQALLRRSHAGETGLSISLSLGRSGGAVIKQLHRRTNPKYAPGGDGRSGIVPDRSVNWASAVERAMTLLPGERGTVHDVIAMLQQLQYKLDRSIAPGKTGERCHHLVSAALYRCPQFQNTGTKVGRASVWEYKPELASTRPLARREASNAKARKAGYDSLPMKTG